MHVATIALAHLLASCAPRVGPRTMSSIVAVESGGSPLAIHDNDTGRSYAPRTRERARALATVLIGAGHSVDLGLAQINSGNLRALGLTVREAFDPCLNVGGGATILRFAYRRAGKRYGAGQFALRRALGAYNTGSLERGDGYIALVLAAAAGRRRLPATVTVIDGERAHDTLSHARTRRAASTVVAAAPKVTPEAAPILVQAAPSTATVVPLR